MNLSPLSHQSRLESPELDKMEGEINKAIAALQKQCDEHTSEVASLHSTARHLMSAKQLARAPELKIAAVELMRAEFRLRHRIKTEYLPLLHQATAEAAQKAFEYHAEKSAEIKSKLVGIGYVDGLIPDLNVEGVTHDILFAHPEVRAAHFEHVSANNFLQDRTPEQTNDEAMKKLGADIDEAVRLILATNRI